MKKLSFIERVKKFIQGGDEAKLARFDSKLQKFFAKQIAKRKEQIESLTDKIADEQERLQETILNVDVQAINSTEGTESYCARYVKSVEQVQDRIDELEAQIAALEDEIAKLENLQEVIYETGKE